MNIFDTEDHAHDAQEAAKLFVDEGSLNGKIYPNSFTEDVVLAQFSHRNVSHPVLLVNILLQG